MRFARAGDPDRRTHRDLADAWLEALAASGLPLARPPGRARAPLTFAAPLPAGIECRSELADLVLSEHRPVWAVRDALERSAPPGITVMAVEDVWTGARPLAAAIEAADYTIALTGTEADRASLRDAVRAFLSATRLDRDRPRGSGTITYDIRPLVESISVDDGPPASLRVRVRFLPDRGAGRPDEVLAALEGLSGGPIGTGPTVRERVLVAA